MLRIFLILLFSVRAPLQGAWAKDVFDDNPPRMQLSGFATMAYTDAGRRDLLFARDASQFPGANRHRGFAADSRVGVQLNWQVGSEIDAVIQAVGRSLASPRSSDQLDLSFLRWRPGQDTRLRLGRFGVDIYAISEFKSVGYSYPWVRPPREFYYIFPFQSLDGIDLTHGFQTEVGKFEARGFLGRSSFVSNSTGRSRVRVNGASLNWQADNWQLGATYAYVKSTSTNEWAQAFSQQAGSLSILWPEAGELAAYFDGENFHGNYAALNVSHERGPWQFVAEVSHAKVASPVLPAGLRYYMSLARHFGAWTPYLVYAAVRDPFDRHFSSSLPFLTPVATAANEALGYARMRQRTWSLGLRWDFAAQADVKLQWDRSFIEPAASGMWGGSNPAWVDGVRRKDVFSIALDFLF